MTNEEARKILTAWDLNLLDYDDASKFGEAFQMALKALEQQQNIITQIEQARDKDKNAGEYPYNKCIEIIRRANNGL